MPWTSDFKVELSRGFLTLRYVLVGVGIPANVLRPYGGMPRLSSFPAPGYLPIIRADRSAFSGGTLSVRDWTCNPLTFDVGITDRELMPVNMIQRGQCVALKVGFNDDIVSFQTVAIGTIYALSYSSGGWIIRCRGLEGSLMSRWTTTADEQSLGHDLLATTTTEAVSNGEASIDLASVTGLPTTGGVVQITANDQSTYFVKYTGISTLTLTGCTTPAFGTTFSTTSSGATVNQFMWANGHPLEIAAQILTSTGDGTNGAYDVLPESWGFGIPQQYLWERDVVRHVGIRQPASGADNWDWIREELDNTQSALAEWLAGGGYYITQGQGCITARGAVLPWAAASSAGLVLRDADVVSVDGYETWDADSPVEYRKTRIEDASGGTDTSAASPLDHLPAIGIHTHTPGGIYSTTTNRTAIIAELHTILKDWDTRTPEWLSLTLRGRWWGTLTPGDGIELELSVIRSRVGGDFYGKRALVTRASAEWFGGHAVTYVELLILPLDEVTAWRPSA